MGFHVQIDLKAIEQAASAAGAEGISVRDHLGGLALMYHHVWTKKSDEATRGLLMGWFAVGPDQVGRLISGLIAFGHLEPRYDSWRIKGAGRYESLRQKLSEGGKKSAGNLKQFAAQPSASTSSSQSGPAAPSTPAAGKKSRELSEWEQCWDVMERLRVEHCTQLGLEPGASPRPRLCNTRLSDAAGAVGITDSIANGETFSRCDMFTLLFERYLKQDRIGLKDIKTGKPCKPPWPIPLFLSAGVLERLKADYDNEETAA